MSNSPTPPNSPSSSSPGARVPAATVIGHPPQPGNYIPAQAPPDTQNHLQAGGYPQQPQAGGYPQQPPAGGYPQQPPAGSYPQQPPPGGYPQQPAPPVALSPEAQASLSQQALQYPPPTLPQADPPRVQASPRPVPSVSPPAKEFRPSRNPIVRLLLWATEPSMIKGMAMGVVLALVISVAFRLEAMWFIASSILTLLITCLFGVLIGHYVFENRRKKLQRVGLQMLRQAGGELPGLSERLINLVWTRDRSHIAEVWEHLRRIRPAAEEIAGLSIAAAFRVMAMSTLFAVLGGAISFAVFLTSYMQVERMDFQNKLIGQQIDQTRAQMEFAASAQAIDVALSIAERRQITIRELLAVVNNDGKPGAGKRTLTAPTANLIAIAVDQLEPYAGLTVDHKTGQNTISPQVKSPEQEQLLRYLAATDVDFAGLDLSRAFLDHADLHDVDLSQIVLPRVSLRQAQLYDAKLVGASLAGADLTLAALARTDLSGSNLAAASLHRANLVGANLTAANLTNADLSAAVVSDAVLKQAQLGRAVLHGARLDKCDLTNADLVEADFAFADLREAALPQVPNVRKAAFWWLGLYPPDYAAKLGLGAEAQQRNKAGFDRIHAAPPLGPAEIAAVVAELKAAAPSAPS